MPYPDFPADDDVKGLIGASGAAIPCNFPFAGYGNLGRQEFERRTDRIPFLKDDQDVDRFYDPPTPSAHSTTLFLDAGLLELASVTLGYSGVGTGQTLTQGVDFVLMDYNAPSRGMPWESIKFTVRNLPREFSHYSPNLGGVPRSIKVTGKWGYSETVPDDAYMAALRIGAWLALTDLKEALSTDSIDWAEGDVRERMSIELIQKIGESYQGFIDRVVARYRFIR